MSSSRLKSTAPRAGIRIPMTVRWNFPDSRRKTGRRSSCFPNGAVAVCRNEHLRIDKIHHEIAAQTARSWRPSATVGILFSKPIPSAQSPRRRRKPRFGNGRLPERLRVLFAARRRRSTATKSTDDDARLKPLRPTAWKRVALNRLVDGIYLVHRWTETKADLFPLQTDEQYFLYDENNFFICRTNNASRETHWAEQNRVHSISADEQTGVHPAA